MKEIVIGKNASGQRLDRYIVKAFGLTIGAIMKAIRKKDIRVNGKRADPAYKLAEGDVLRLYITTEEKRGNIKINLENAPCQLNILYEDENLMLIDKPVNMLCHDGELSGKKACDTDTLINRVKAYLYQKGEFVPEASDSFEPALCNRIDRNTGGIVIAAKTAETLRILNEKLRLREVKKRYLCILAGVPKLREATLTAFLEKDSAKNEVKISNKKSKNNKTIITKYKVLEVRDNLALTEVELVTGRTHQIRAHMAYIGYPLLGDGKYGNNRVNKSHGFTKQALYSYKIAFEFNEACQLDYINGKTFEVDEVWFLKKFYEIPLP